MITCGSPACHMQWPGWTRQYLYSRVFGGMFEDREHPDAARLSDHGRGARGISGQHVCQPFTHHIFVTWTLYLTAAWEHHRKTTSHVQSRILHTHFWYTCSLIYIPTTLLWVWLPWVVCCRTRASGQRTRQSLSHSELQLHRLIFPEGVETLKNRTPQGERRLSHRQIAQGAGTMLLQLHVRTCTCACMYIHVHACVQDAVTHFLHSDTKL